MSYPSLPWARRSLRRLSTAALRELLYVNAHDPQGASPPVVKSIGKASAFAPRRYLDGLAIICNPQHRPTELLLNQFGRSLLRSSKLSQRRQSLESSAQLNLSPS